MLVSRLQTWRPAQLERWAASPLLRRWMPVAAALLLLAVLTLVAALRAGGEAQSAAPAASGQSAPPPLVTSSFANRDGGYELAYPATWRNSVQGTRTKLMSPDGAAIVSIGRAEKGSLKQTSDQFVRLVRRGYKKVSVTGRQRDTVAGAPALAVAGEAKNPDGVRIRWMGIAVERAARPMLVAVYTHAEADPSEVLPATQEIVSSLRFTK